MARRVVHFYCDVVIVAATERFEECKTKEKYAQTLNFAQQLAAATRALRKKVCE
jgi:hypothetical protein